MAPPRGQDDGGWIEVADQVQAEAFAHLANPTGQGKVRTLEHGVLFSTGIPSRTFNGLVVTRRPADPVEALSSARSFAERLKVPWSVAGRAETLDGMKSAIATAGLQPFDSEPGMLLDLLNAEVPAPPERLRVLRAENSSRVRSCFRTLAAGYEIPLEVLTPLLGEGALQAYSDNPALSFHVGYVGEDPVAGSVGLDSKRVSYVFMVATVPAFRRRGFGEALTWSAVRAARDRGCQVSYLRATEEGRPLYEKMGYREVTRHVSFSL